jgi:hypothetical protein
MVGFEFNLFGRVQMPSINHTDCTETDLNTQYLKLYPNGISNHGVNHLTFDVYMKDEKSLYLSTKPLMEYIFELVRLKDFKDKPSRFESYFGCLTLEDAEILKRDIFLSPRTIYKVSSEEYFIADMNWMHLGGTILETFVLAEKYWSGIQSSKFLLEALLKSPKIVEKIG